MKRRLALFGGFFLLALTAAAQSQSGGDKNSSKAQVAATADILKIDAKKIGYDYGYNYDYGDKRLGFMKRVTG